MAKILSAQPVVDHLKKNLFSRCEALKNRGIIPTMSVVLVGDNPASLSYIRNKKKICEEVGAKFSLVQLSPEISENDFLNEIKKLNDDDSIHGIIIQLPVTEKLKKLNIPELVVPHKDIDGFHAANTQFIYAGTATKEHMLPCTPKGIIHLLKFYQIPIKGQNIVIIGRSLIVGKPLSMLLSNHNATVTLAHSHTKDIKALTRQADIVISAIGQAHYVDASFFDPEKQTVVIDVGMNSLNGKLTGDVNLNDSLPVISAITPVPGGVGPMTVVSLIENLVTATENKFRG